MFEQQLVRYAPSTGSTTSAPSRSSTGRRVRVVRLLRPRSRQQNNPRAVPSNFGFSLRGGSEHGTGFFISHVEPESEAYYQGLKCGDQVIAVNGFRVEDAVHSELTHYIANQNRIKMKVRNVGVIPVKEKSHEHLSWKYVSETHSMLSETSSSSPTICERIKEVQLSLLVPPKARLGLGICKGPDWKPGIFVQFIKDQGIARDAGLRAGDQIMACNGVDFRDITFNEAVSIMKQCGRLILRVRPGAGPELVSGESSGYNSSASSEPATRSARKPHATLASLSEERVDRYNNNLKRHTWNSVDFDWKPLTRHRSTPPSDIEPDYDTNSNPDNHTFTTFKTNPANRTIINLTENGATIECSYDGRRVIENKKYSNDGVNGKKTIVVEVHHNTPGKERNSMPPAIENGSSADCSSMSSCNTLSSAIADEINRRKLKKENGLPASLTPAKKNAVLKPVDDVKKKQHDALMDEFKKMHKKMFSSKTDLTLLEESHDDNHDEELDRQATLQLKQQQQQTKLNGLVKNGNQSNGTINGNGFPPPPPPMPAKEEQSKQNGSKVTTSTPINGIVKNGQNGVHDKPLQIPPPDYDMNHIDSITSKLKMNGISKRHTVEFQSYSDQTNIAQKKLNTPGEKKVRPVSVTIGEYPSNTLRKEPSKLGFLNGDTNGNSHDETDDAPISSRLQSELAMTLSRSNLKKKTDSVAKKDIITIESLPNTNGGEESDNNSIDKNFHIRYGNNILPMPPKITIPKVPIKAINNNNNTETTDNNTTTQKIDPFKSDSFPHNGTVKEKTLFLNGARFLNSSRFETKKVAICQTSNGNC